MMWKSIRGNCMVHTSSKKSPSIYDEDKRSSNGVIKINSIPYSFKNNSELKKLLRMRREMLMVA